jgi:HK97 family phage major capsid protein
MGTVEQILEEMKELKGKIVTDAELKTFFDEKMAEVKKELELKDSDEAKELKSKLESHERLLASIIAGSGKVEEKGKNEEMEIKNKAVEKYLRKGEAGLSEVELKTMTAGNDTTGGYLAGSQLMSEIIRNEVEMDPLLMLADVKVTTQRDSVFIQVNDLTGASHVGEIEDAPEEDFSFKEVRVPNHTLAKTVVVSKEDIQDANFPLVQEIGFQLGQAFGITSNADFVTGNGVNKAQGFLTNAEVIAGAVETIGVGTFTYKDIIKLWGALKKSYRANASFIADRAILTLIMMMEDGGGRPIFTDKPLSEYPMSVGTLFGRPVYDATSMTDTVAAGNYILAVGDWKQGYFISNRQNVEIMRDDYTGAQKRVVKFHGSKRVGGQVKKAEAIKVLKVKA